jgi:hypothetical protein
MEFRTASRQWAQLRSNIHHVYLWEGLSVFFAISNSHCQLVENRIIHALPRTRYVLLVVLQDWAIGDLFGRPGMPLLWTSNVPEFKNRD